MRDKNGPSEDPDNRKRRYTEQSREKARERFTGGGPHAEDNRTDFAGLGTTGSMMRRRDDEEEEAEDDFERRQNRRRSAGCKRFMKNLSLFCRSG